MALSTTSAPWASSWKTLETNNQVIKAYENVNQRKTIGAIRTQRMHRTQDRMEIRGKPIRVFVSLFTEVDSELRNTRPLAATVPCEQTCICQPRLWKNSVTCAAATIISFGCHLNFLSQKDSCPEIAWSDSPRWFTAVSLCDLCDSSIPASRIQPWNLRGNLSFASRSANRNSSLNIWFSGW